MTSSPAFPPELEQEVFLLAYRNSHKDAKNLILIAKRALDWLVPHVYNVVILMDHLNVPIKFNESVYKRYGHHVHHLLLGSDNLSKHLPLFPNLTNLAFWAEYEPEFALSILPLPLTRLAIGLRLGLQPILVNVTHLDLLYSFDPNNETVKAVIRFPKLTHLSVYQFMKMQCLELFLDKERCPSLKVLVLCIIGSAKMELKTDVELPVDDDRVVAVKFDAIVDWERGARGGVDAWEFAEKAIEEKKRDRS